MNPRRTARPQGTPATPRVREARETRETPAARRSQVIDQALGQIIATPPRDEAGVNAHPFPAPRDAVDAVINFFEWNSILAVPGDFLKTGTFHGHGLCRAARHLCRKARGKRLLILDDCDLGLALTPSGRGLSKVDVVFGDARKVDFSGRTLSFAWVCRHTSPFFDPACDFELAWPLLSARAGLVFDLGPNPPQALARRVEEIVAAHRAEIFGSYRLKDFGLRFVVKR
jgi:hypothetical protein